MLEGFSKHGFFDLHMECDGDLQVDSHHTIKNSEIVLGDAIKKALRRQNENQTPWKLYISDQISYLFCVRSIYPDVMVLFDSRIFYRSIWEHLIPK